MSVGSLIEFISQYHIANMPRHILDAKTEWEASNAPAPEGTDRPALFLAPPGSSSPILIDSYTRGNVSPNAALKGHVYCNVQLLATDGYRPSPRLSSTISSTPDSSDRDLLLSLQGNNFSAAFSDDTLALSRHRLGAQMLRDGLPKKFSTLADGVESSPSPHAIDHSTISNPSTASNPSTISKMFTEFDTSKQTHLVVQKPIGDSSAPKVDLMRYRHNMIATRDPFNIANSDAEQNRNSFARPECGLNLPETEELKQHFSSEPSKLFDVHNQQALIKRKPIAISNPSNNDGNIPRDDPEMRYRAADLLSAFSFQNPAELSFQFDKLSLSSNDSSSTVADESWNPVEEFIGDSSSDEQLILRYGVSFFDANAHLGIPPKPAERLSKDPSEMSFADARHKYPLHHANMAGHKDGTAVWDAAYFSGKAPETELEWTNVQLVSKHGISLLSPGAASLVDTASLADTASLTDTAPLTDIAPFADLASLATSADLTNPHDSETGLDERVMLSAEVHNRSVPAPANGEDMLEDFLQELPAQTIRFIAEDAACIFDYSKGSDDDDEKFPFVENNVPRFKDATTFIANNEDSDEEFPIRGEGLFPTTLPSDLRRSHNSNYQTSFHHERSDFTGLFQRRAAHMPKLPDMYRHRHDELNRNFLFSVRDGDSQYMMNTPLLNENEHVPEAKYEHRSPIGRVLDTLKSKSKGSRKLIKHRTEPRKSFLRRQVARLDTFLERKNW
jgi:hypothetical protein